jgi:preprotein translocase subunit SecD
MKAQSLADLKNRAVSQAIETIRNRIDQLGVSEPVIQEHGLGQYQILVQLAGRGRSGAGEGNHAVDGDAGNQAIAGRAVFERTAALQAHGGVLPPDAVLMPGKSIGSRNTESGESWYLISRASAVTGRDLRTAEPGTDENGQPAVRFILTSEGGRKFYAPSLPRTSATNLAVVLDNKVQEVAVIKDSDPRQRRHQRRFTPQETQDLSMTLRSGALPAGIKYLEERTVGPSLGADSIRSGVQAAVYGMLAVLIFMLIYYRWAGVNADIALILNLVILLGFMGYFGAVLTLPGIAGVILTVGMGVDSNVLIFERIREELRNGKTPPSAVEQGFSHAWITIVDTHVTTIVSAAILFIFGTGPVKGLPRRWFLVGGEPVYGGVCVAGDF